MKSIVANQESVEDIFSRRHFIIPDFQRPYSWSELQCSQLFSDLTSAFHDFQNDKAEDQSYFLGNIIYYTDESGGKTWIIVDGQQRLTTLLMLLRALHEKTRVGKEYAELKRLIYKIDKSTGNAIDGDVRLESRVPPGERGYNPGDLKKVLTLTLDLKKNKKNPFLLNYNRLKDDLDAWWRDNDAQWEGFIQFVCEKVVLLPIKCESEWDALDLFSIINDRGLPLDAADIFKARIYKAVDAKGKSQFIQKWNSLSGHLSLFLIYMHISKAKNAPIGAFSTHRNKLRNYIEDECLKNKKKPLKTNWKSLMDSLELCHFFKINVGKWCKDPDFSAKERIYWKILEAYPNESWQYPLFVFMHKYAKLKGESLVLSENKRDDYLELLERSVKFFFVKGVVHNSIEAVRVTAHKVCVQIEQNDTYLTTYKEECKGDFNDLKRKLSDSDHGKSYRKGLAFLNSFLNSNQQKKLVAYADAICGDIHIEHILPQTWRDNDHYDGWKNKDAFEECVEKIGNLMPLEQRINIRSSDFFFRVKQKEYKISKIEDAKALSKQNPARWHPKDLEIRHDEAVKRLMIFFKR